MNQPVNSALRHCRRHRRIGVLMLAVFAVAGCSSSDEEAFVERPVGEIYNEATDALDAGDYVTAAESFGAVEQQHPYSDWARRAMLMGAYSYYRANEYDQAIAATERYISLYPASDSTSYAYYLKAICHYEQISDVFRDQHNTEEALAALEDVTRRYPRTRYARDAAIKIDLARDHLAGKEVEIGRYYLGQRSYLAAIRRFRNVVENYQTTSHIPEALYRLTEAWLAIGVVSEAREAARILGYNYPGSRWYLDGYTLLQSRAPDALDTPDPTDS